MASDKLPCLTLKNMKEVPNKPLGRQKIRRPNALECVFNKRYTDRTVYYFTTGNEVNRETMRDVSKEPTPFWFPGDAELSSYGVIHETWRQTFRKQEQKYDVRTRPTYTSRQNLDLLKRLYMPDEEAEKEHDPLLLDLDPDFFKIVEGRPIREKFDIREYINDVRETLKTRLIAGYNLDEVMRLDEKHFVEQRTLKEIDAKYKLYNSNFDAFLEKDHNVSIGLLRDASSETKKSEELSEVFRNLNKVYGAVKAEVYILEEKWRNCKMYQKFLYLISPMYWRKKHDYIHRKGGERGSDTSIVSELSSLFGRYRLPSVGNVASLQDLLEMFMEEIRTGEEPLLFFSDIEQLSKVFQEMELQNLNCLLHSESLSEPINGVKQGLNDARKQFETEAEFIRDKIKDIETAIEWEEERTKFLESKAKELLHGSFKDVVASEDTLKLYVFVEDVYEHCIAPNDSNLGMYDMMRGVEVKMESLLLKLDYLPYNIVRTAETEMYRDEARMMKEAENAEFKVNFIDKLKWRLRRSLEPPAYRSGRTLKPRSEPPGLKKKKPKPERELTQQEKDYLNFFTEYCHHEDDARNYFPLRLS